MQCPPAMRFSPAVSRCDANEELALFPWVNALLSAREASSRRNIAQNGPAVPPSPNFIRQRSAIALRPGIISFAVGPAAHTELLHTLPLLENLQHKRITLLCTPEPPGKVCHSVSCVLDLNIAVYILADSINVTQTESEAADSTPAWPTAVVSLI